MSENTRLLDKSAQDKINDCLETLREMQEIEIQLQQSCGVKPHITTLCSCDIDSWLQRWKRTRERNVEFYTCLLGDSGQTMRELKVTLRMLAVLVVREIFRNTGIESSVVEDPNPSQLQALHEEHLQEELDQLEMYLLKIQAKHRFLTNQVRSKVV